MTIDHVLSVVPVTDIATSRAWYEKLFGVEPTNTPMPPLAEWQVTPAGWVQVFEDDQRAGHGQLNLAVSDLEGSRAELLSRGLEPDEIVDATKGVRISSLRDPDGNVVTLIGGFRVDY